MHVALWTRLDILPTCVALAQYQMHTAPIHFAAIKYLVGYMRLHPDLPLVNDRTRFQLTVSTLNIDIDPALPFSPGFYGPEAYDIGSVDLLPLTHTLYVGSLATDDASPIIRVPPHIPTKQREFTPDPQSDVPFQPGLASSTRFGPSSGAPYTESYVDANLPGGSSRKLHLLALPYRCQVLVFSLTAAKLPHQLRILQKLRWTLPINSDELSAGCTS